MFGNRHKLRNRPYLELAHDIVTMSLDRTLGRSKFVRNLLIQTTRLKTSRSRRVSCIACCCCLLMRALRS